MQAILDKVFCYHCGDECHGDEVVTDAKHFCCTGCKLVFEILRENNLCSYYDLNKAPGKKQQEISGKRFSFLDEPSVIQKLIRFKKDNEVHVTFLLPSMHCSSCIWLLENFRRIDPGILSSRVDFLNKEIQLVFDDRQTTLRKIAEELTRTGYEPSLHLEAMEKKERKKTNRSRILRIGVAGFCFGNIMMLSFPEYFSSGKITDPGLKSFFTWLNLFLSLPVFFYSASEFFIRSWQALRYKTSSIDIPIALGIAAIFLRSAYEILSQTGAGYLDSGSGLVFFMLIGRWFQDYTFDALSFERDYKSYFPIAITCIRNGMEKDVLINDLRAKDKILIRNQEIIPVDAILLDGDASIDYHFVTGEAVPVHHQAGETVFAGGRQLGSIIELQVIREISQSYLTRLWNNTFSVEIKSRFERMVQAISKWFIAVTVSIALAAALFWWNTDKEKAINAFTAVLVIACPCALALSAPFTYGNIVRILGRNKIYLRNYHTLEKLADVNAVVFDKTGTLTENNSARVNYAGEALSDQEKKIIYSLVRQSSHPLSRILSNELSCMETVPVKDFRELPGKGISARVNGREVKIGSAEFAKVEANGNTNQTKVYVSIQDGAQGYFICSNSYRNGIEQVAGDLAKKGYFLSVLTGDNESEKENLINIFAGKASLHFNQSPEDKLSFIRSLHKKELNVLMLGDGLNDAGALLQCDVGMSVTDDASSFTPASRGIMHGTQLEKLGALLACSKSAVRIIIVSFIISLIYNFIGLSFAVTGTLTPLAAAILMPVSTISLVLFTVCASSLNAKWLGFS